MAPFYDQLSRCIFGQRQVQAQVVLLPLIPPGARILIAGGGTGWILEEITKVHRGGLHITYIDNSRAMIARAKNRETGGNHVSFLHDSVENFSDTQAYDVIITPFLLDNFSDEPAQRIWSILNSHLSPGGIWLHTDFCNPSYTPHKLLLRMMYAFFRITARINATHLPGVEQLFSGNGYTIVEAHRYMKDFIGSTAFRKP